MDNATRRMLDEARGFAQQHQTALAAAMEQYASIGPDFGSALRQASTFEFTARHALEAIRGYDRFSIPDWQKSFQLDGLNIEERLSFLRHAIDWRDSLHLQPFHHTSAIAEALAEARGVTRSVQAAVASLQAISMPVFAHLQECRLYLDAAGLEISRWPRIRRLSQAERRQRFRKRLKVHAPSPQLKKARDLIHNYELSLREHIDEGMAGEYGDDWAEKRLPLCGCQDLLGKWTKRGGYVLDHADWWHYGQIMAHPSHFEAIFALGFEDPQFLAKVVDRIRAHRVATVHAHEFTPDHYRDLRVNIRLLERGLIACDPGIEISYDH